MNIVINLKFHKMLGISSVTEKMFTLHEGPSSTELSGVLLNVEF
jgi:hypothetical protein